MGILDIIFGKKERNKNTGGIDVQIAEQNIKQKIEEENKSFTKEMETFYTNIKKDSRSLEEQLILLQNATVNERIDSQLLSIANTSKKTFKEKMKRVLSVLDSDIPKDIETALNSYASMRQSIEEVDKSSVTEFASLNIVYKKEVELVIEKFRSVKNSIDKFGTKIKEKKEIISPYENLADQINSFKQTKNDVENNKVKLNSLISEIEENNSVKDTKLTYLEQTEDSEEWKNYLKIKEDIKKIKQERIILENEIVKTFSSIEHILKKFNKLVVEKKIEFKNINLIEKYLINSLETFYIDENAAVLNVALKKVIEAFKNQHIFIKGDDKSFDIVNELYTTHKFVQYKEKLISINRQVKDFEEKLSNMSITKLRSKTEFEISQIEVDTENLKIERDRLQMYIPKSEEELNEKKEKLSANIKELLNKEINLG